MNIFIYVCIYIHTYIYCRNGEQVLFLLASQTVEPAARRHKRIYYTFGESSVKGGRATVRSIIYVYATIPKNERDPISPAVFHRRLSTIPASRLLSVFGDRSPPALGGHEKANWCHRTRASGPRYDPPLPPSPPSVSLAPRPVRICLPPSSLFLHLFHLLPLPLLLPPYRTSLPLVPEIWNKNRVARQPGTSGTDELGINGSLFRTSGSRSIVHATLDLPSVRGS